MTSHNIFYVVATLMLGSAIVGCSHSGDTVAVPRPTAYPRVELCDTIYRAESLGGKTIIVNAEALTSITRRDNGNLWIDITYPRYGGATLRLTLSYPDNISDAMANRMQRIGLNVGDSSTRVTQLKHGSIEGIIVTAPEAKVTPLQMLATDNETFIVSGAVDGISTLSGDSPEATAPIIEALHRDIAKLIDAL